MGAGMGWEWVGDILGIAGNGSEWVAGMAGNGSGMALGYL